MINKYIAEGIGTFSLVFAGCGSAIVNDSSNGALGLVGVSLVFGLVVMVMIYSLGDISGAHINPAVTLGLLIAGRFEQQFVLPYIGSQVAGAIVAAFLLRFLFPEHETLGATLPSGSNIQAIVMEVVLSFFLMFVILSVTAKSNTTGVMVAVAIGATVTLDILFGGPVTGASMNPARSLGPALVSGNLNSLWVYIISPVAGAALAYPAFRWVQGAT